MAGVINPRILVLGIGRFQAVVAFLVWLIEIFKNSIWQGYLIWNVQAMPHNVLHADAYGA